jgi:hypothetical protein
MARLGPLKPAIPVQIRAPQLVLASGSHANVCSYESSGRQAQIDRALACYAPRPSALLTDDAARAAMAALAAGDPVKAVADRFGVSIWCIYDLRLGRTFKHLARGGAEAEGAYQPP